VAKLEGMRAELGDASIMLQYFHNEGVNSGPLIGPLYDISQKVCVYYSYLSSAHTDLHRLQVTATFVASFDHKVRRHAVKRGIAQDLKSMILECCTVSAKARQAAFTSLDTTFSSFPVLLCDSELLIAMLECLTLLRNACESEMDDEVGTPRPTLLLLLADDSISVQCCLRIRIQTRPHSIDSARQLRSPK
jgi:phosphatidylinositol 4-kinase